jgi:hypothetical protein
MSGDGDGRFTCPVCDSIMSPFAPGRVLRKYDVTYVRCPRCALITLPEPFWLDEAYEKAIADGDVGLLRRCRVLSTLTAAVVRAEGLRDGVFLDWAGGYGTLTRMMRDKGLEFFHWDPYADNLFAQGLALDPKGQRFDLVTAFEVVEHLKDPVVELAECAEITDRLLFTTELQPEGLRPGDEWWYFAPESGQHIAFHTPTSLRLLGERLGYRVTSNGDQYHLFHRGPVRPATRALLSPAVSRTKRTVGAALRRVRKQRAETAAPSAH